MSLSYYWRTWFPQEVGNRFIAYWHAMHPVDFDDEEIYRAGYTPDEWYALNLLMQRRKDCITSGYKFHYIDKDSRVRMILQLPKKYKDCPGIHVDAKDADISEELRNHLAGWHGAAKRWDTLHSQIITYVHALVEVDNKKRPTNGVNTIRQLYAIWPELLPCFGPDYQGTIRNTKVQAKPPSSWTEDEVTAFRQQEYMEEINHALAVMTLIPNKVDSRYPSV